MTPAVLPLSFHCAIVHLPGIWPECGFEYKAPWTQQSWDIWQDIEDIWEVE